MIKEALLVRHLNKIALLRSSHLLWFNFYILVWEQWLNIQFPTEPWVHGAVPKVLWDRMSVACPIRCHSACFLHFSLSPVPTPPPLGSWSLSSQKSVLAFLSSQTGVAVGATGAWFGISRRDKLKVPTKNRVRNTLPFETLANYPPVLCL